MYIIIPASVCLIIFGMIGIAIIVARQVKWRSLSGWDKLRHTAHDCFDAYINKKEADFRNKISNQEDKAIKDIIAALENFFKSN